MLQYGLEPELPPEARAQLRHLPTPDLRELQDARHLLWSSIDNDESRDLDQLEVCSRQDGVTRLCVAIADVDTYVGRGTPIDQHAQANTTSVYTPARIFPMLPEPLSTDRTSLAEGADRVAVVVDMRFDAQASLVSTDVYRALVRNRARLTYAGVGAWLEGTGPVPEALGANADLAAQVRLQDELATHLHARRRLDGALEFDRDDVVPIMEGGRVTSLRTVTPNRARAIIETFMIATNAATAAFLATGGYATIRRVVKSPDRWPRIIELAAALGTTLPDTPDAAALDDFLAARRIAAPDAFASLSLAVLKLLGRGEYVAHAAPAGPHQDGGPQRSASADGFGDHVSVDARPGRTGVRPLHLEGATSDGAPHPAGSMVDAESMHFALALSNYTHSTAPNRRFPDLITQRLLKAAIQGAPSPYHLEELDALATHCTQREDAANKVERLVKKSAAALWMGDRIGSEFDAVVTGAAPKGTWVRLDRIGIEGKLERGFEGLDVGDRVRVRLTSVDADRGFVDFARA